MITWIRWFRVPPAQADELVRALHGVAHPALAALAGEGKVHGWAIAVPLSHHDDGWTHLLWADFEDWAAVEGFVGTLVDLVLPGEVARDAFLRPMAEPATRSAVRPAYAVFHLHWIRRGLDDDALALFNEWAKPVFVELAEAGKVGAWALMTEDTAVSGEWRYLVRYPLDGLEALDGVFASLMKFELPRLKSFDLRLREMSERGYRGVILRVLHAGP